MKMISAAILSTVAITLTACSTSKPAPAPQPEATPWAQEHMSPFIQELMSYIESENEEREAVITLCRGLDHTSQVQAHDRMGQGEAFVDGHCVRDAIARI